MTIRSPRSFIRTRSGTRTFLGVVCITRIFYCCYQFCRISSFQFSYSSGYGPLLIGPKAIAQNPFEYFAGAALWEFDLWKLDPAWNLVIREGLSAMGDQFIRGE